MVLITVNTVYRTVYGEIVRDREGLERSECVDSESMALLCHNMGIDKFVDCTRAWKEREVFEGIGVGISRLFIFRTSEFRLAILTEVFEAVLKTWSKVRIPRNRSQWTQAAQYRSRWERSQHSYGEYLLQVVMLGRFTQ